MWDLLEFLGYCALPIVFFSVLFDPEGAAEKLGRCVAAFRRGLEGETTQDNTEHEPVSNPEQHVSSANRN
jgi:hypothetical protein